LYIRQDSLDQVFGDQHALPLYLTIGNIQNNIRQTPAMHTWILVGLSPCPPTGTNITDTAQHSAVGTVLSTLQNFDITVPGLKWTFPDQLQRQ
jgi:hypothetical protein